VRTERKEDRDSVTLEVSPQKLATVFALKLYFGETKFLKYRNFKSRGKGCKKRHHNPNVERVSTQISLIEAPGRQV